MVWEYSYFTLKSVIIQHYEKTEALYPVARAWSFFTFKGNVVRGSGAAI